jgi:hypothetical protein
MGAPTQAEGLDPTPCGAPDWPEAEISTTCRRVGFYPSRPHKLQKWFRFDFKLVAVKTISWGYDADSPNERVTFEYGGLQVRYSERNPTGTFAQPSVGGWNRVKNVQDLTSGPLASA